VVERDQEAVVALGLDLGFLKAVDLGMLAGPVLVDQGCLSLNLGPGLAWVLLPGAVVPGQVFVRCLGILGFLFLLSLGDFVDSALGSHLCYLIRILRSLHLGFGLEVALVLVVGMPSLTERQGWVWTMILMARQEVWRSLLVSSLGSEMAAICGEQVSPRVCSRPFKEQGRVPVLQDQGRRRVISPLPKIKGCT